MRVHSTASVRARLCREKIGTGERARTQTTTAVVPANRVDRHPRATKLSDNCARGTTFQLPVVVIATYRRGI